jgi:hypothetical protein
MDVVMYDPLETELSRKEMDKLIVECRRLGVEIAIIGGWAVWFHVNPLYNLSFGKPYIESRDIDIFFYKKDDIKLLKIIKSMGFIANRLPNRWVKFYDREKKQFISEDEQKQKSPYNILCIFLDLFSNEKSTAIESWCDLEPLKPPSIVKINNYDTVDLETLIELKCIAMAKRERSDKEPKDACDLYALLEYGNKKIKVTKNLIPAIERLLNRQDLSNIIAQSVLLDIGKQNLVINSLQTKLRKLVDEGFIESKS